MEHVMFHSFILLIAYVVAVASMKNGIKTILKDTSGHTGINFYWNWTTPDGWHISNNRIVICSWIYPRYKGKNCTIISSSYDMKNVNQLFVEVDSESRIRDCSSNTEKKSCTESFDLLAYYGNDVKISNRVEGIGSLPAKANLPSVGFYNSRDLVSLERNKKYKYLKLALRSANYCGTIHAVKLFYYSCSSSNFNTFDLIDLVDTVAPSKSSSPIMLSVKCVKNAVREIESRSVKARCYYNGSVEIFGNCVCKSGYTNIQRKCICRFICFFN